MRINTNLTALNTYNSYTAANNKIANSVAKLSSGYAINSAADNAAGLAISEKMRAQIRGLDKAASNSQDAISLVQTAEGALKSAGEILQRMRELSVQSASDTNEDTIDRGALQAEFEQLQAELDEISEDTTFNNQNLLDGSLSKSNKYVSSNDITGLNSMCVGQADAGTYTVAVTQHGRSKCRRNDGRCGGRNYNNRCRLRRYRPYRRNHRKDSRAQTIIPIRCRYPEQIPAR